MSNLPVQYRSTAVAASQPQRRGAVVKSLADRLEERRQTISPGLYCFPPGAGPTADERAFAEARIVELDRLLDEIIPDDGGTIVEEVCEQVHASFKFRDTKVTEQQIYDGFLIALPGRSAPAVREALRRIIRDEAPAEYSRTFAPTPGDLAKLSRQVEGGWDVEVQRLRNALAIPEANVDIDGRPATAADRQRVEEFKSRLGGTLRQIGGVSR